MKSFQRNKRKEFIGRNNKKMESAPIIEARSNLFILAFLLNIRETEVNNRKSKEKFKKKRMSKYTFIVSPMIS